MNDYAVADLCVANVANANANPADLQFDESRPKRQNAFLGNKSEIKSSSYKISLIGELKNYSGNKKKTINQTENRPSK